MLRHEQFEEICAAASIGQATPEELFELERHAALCESCRQAYVDCLDFAARSLVAADQAPALSPQEAQQCLDSDLFTHRFYERAEREGIIFSRQIGQKSREALPPPLPFRRRFTRMRPAWATAAVVLIGLIVSYFYRDLLFHGAPAAAQNPLIGGLETRIADLTSANLELRAEIDRMSAKLAEMRGLLGANEKNLNTTQEDRQKLEAQLTDARRLLLLSQALAQSAQLEADKLRASANEAGATQAAHQARIQTLTQALSDAQHQLTQSQALAESARLEAGRLRERVNEAELTLTADQMRISDLTKELNEKTGAWERERQLLALGRDVTDLMAARNLHIVDVVDTDRRGKDRPAFGRIFFTEDKSLVFYAYDLNEARIEKGNLEYRIWARREGQPQQVRNLGIFYADNKAQRRWVYKCNDPKILSEIDSVFVTLEPKNGDLKHPNGTNLMYAYLRGQPNHP